VRNGGAGIFSGGPVEEAVNGKVEVEGFPVKRPAAAGELEGGALSWAGVLQGWVEAKRD